MAELIDRLSIRNKLYDADAITMRGVAMLNQEPTVEAVPVVHARWILTEHFSPFQKCSACGFEMPMVAGDGTGIVLYPYCPNCGAKMDGKE